MGSCLGKDVNEKDNQEEMLTTYKVLNKELAVSRNNELLSMRMVVRDLIGQNKILHGYLQLEINEKERLQNPFPVVVWVKQYQNRYPVKKKWKLVVNLLYKKDNPILW